MANKVKFTEKDINEMVYTAVKRILKEDVIKYYIVDDGGVYNVISSEDFDKNGKYIENPSYSFEDFDIVKTVHNMDMAWKICDRLNGEDKIDESIENDDVSFKVDWGTNIESMISRLSEIFAETNMPEKDEYGIARTEFDNLVAHLKYYYDKDVFDRGCFNSIYKCLDNYDLIQNEEVKEILNNLNKLA